MQWRFILPLTFLLIAPSVFAHPHPHARSHLSPDAFAKQRMLQFMKRYRVQGAAIALLSHGKVRTYVFGEALPARHLPVSENTLFELGSITKTFTGVLLAEHLLAGRTHLDEPIHTTLDIPHSRPVGQLTYQQLATHVSGLPFNASRLPYNASASLFNRMRMHYYLKRAHLLFSPGTHMLYSNFAYGLLGQLLAKQAHLPLTTLMQQNILSPLHMHASGLDLNGAQLRYMAQGYTAQGRPADYLPSGLLGGAWAMRASIKDMGIYLKAAAGDASTPAPLRRAMRLAQTPYYDLTSEGMQFGLGWVITPFNRANQFQRLIRRPEHYHFIPYRGRKILHPRFNPYALIGKTGATDGFRAYMAVIPARQVGIVVLTNRFTRCNGRLTSLANEILLRE